MMDPVEYFIETRGNQCENCGAKFQKFTNEPTRHHCLVRVSKKHPEYDHEINIELAGWSCCHEKGILDTHEHKEEFARRQIARGYGVSDWYASLNLKAPEAWLLNL